MKLTCNHSSSSVCSGCIPERSNDTPEIIKCDHNTTSFCPNCIPKSESKLRITPESLSLRCVCRTGANNKCTVCSRAEELLINTIPFKKHLENLSKSCLTKKHSNKENCNLCQYVKPEPIPPSLLTGSIIKCNHRPYPMGSCSNCLPKPFHLKSQTFRRIDYIVFNDKRAIEKLISQWQNDLTQTFSVYLYGTVEPEPESTQNKLSMRATIKAVSKRLIIKPNKVLGMLNLQLIGEAKCILPTKEERIMYPEDILKACKLSNNTEFSFTFVYFKFDKNNVIDSTALTVSEQCMSLFNIGVLSDVENSIVLKRPNNNPEYLPEDNHLRERLLRLEQLPLVLHNGKEIKYYENSNDNDESKISEELFIVKSVISSAAEQQFMFKNCKFGWLGQNECIKSFIEVNINDTNLLSDFNFLMEVGEFLDVGTLMDVTDKIKRNMNLSVDYNYKLVSMFC